MKAVIYARYSSDNQREESIEGQIRECTAFAEKNDITSCIECGSCQFTCPSHRPLLDMIRVGKSTVMGIIRSRAAK